MSKTSKPRDRWSQVFTARLGQPERMPRDDSECWQVYKKRDGFWSGAWIAQPPGATFGESHAFDGPRAFDHAIHYATERVNADE